MIGVAFGFFPETAAKYSRGGSVSVSTRPRTPDRDVNASERSFAVALSFKINAFLATAAEGREWLCRCHPANIWMSHPELAA